MTSEDMWEYPKGLERCQVCWVEMIVFWGKSGIIEWGREEKGEEHQIGKGRRAGSPIWALPASESMMEISSFLDFLVCYHQTSL